jgi:hypothetical protein
MTFSIPSGPFARLPRRADLDRTLHRKKKWMVGMECAESVQRDASPNRTLVEVWPSEGLKNTQQYLGRFEEPVGLRAALVGPAAPSLSPAMQLGPD